MLAGLKHLFVYCFFVFFTRASSLSDCLPDCCTDEQCATRPLQPISAVSENKSESSWLSVLMLETFRLPGSNPKRCLIRFEGAGCCFSFLFSFFFCAPSFIYCSTTWLNKNAGAWERLVPQEMKKTFGRPCVINIGVAQGHIVRLPSSELKVSGDKRSSGPAGCIFLFVGVNSCLFVSFSLCCEWVLVVE